MVKTDADIYRKAAELIDKRKAESIGHALRIAANNVDSQALLIRLIPITEIFSGDIYLYATKEQRVLALLLMAAISENP